MNWFSDLPAIYLHSAPMDFRKALHYLDHQWPRLIGYLQDGRYPTDNNPVENAIRGLRLGERTGCAQLAKQALKRAPTCTA